MKGKRIRALEEKVATLEREVLALRSSARTVDVAAAPTGAPTGAGPEWVGAPAGGGVQAPARRFETKVIQTSGGNWKVNKFTKKGWRVVASSDNILGGVSVTLEREIL